MQSFDYQACVVDQYASLRWGITQREEYHLSQHHIACQLIYCMPGISLSICQRSLTQTQQSCVVFHQYDVRVEQSM